MKVRVSVEQQEELDDAEALEEVQKISYQDESSDVSDSLSMSEDDAGNISDGTDVSETETIRESDSMAERSNNRHPNPLLLNPNMTRTMMMLPPALRPVPPPDPQLLRSNLKLFAKSIKLSARSY